MFMLQVPISPLVCSRLSTFQCWSSSVRVPGRHDPQTRIPAPAWPRSHGGGDGPGEDHPGHLPQGHHQEQECLQRFPDQSWGRKWSSRGHVVHPVPGRHVLLVRVSVSALWPATPVRSDPQWSDQLHVGGELPVETSSALLWLGEIQVRICWYLLCVCQVKVDNWRGQPSKHPL